MKKILFMASFLTLGMFASQKANATVTIYGWASLTTTVTGATVLTCSGNTGVCCQISGNIIAINMLYGWVHGTLAPSVILPPVIPENYPIEVILDEAATN